MEVFVRAAIRSKTNGGFSENLIHVRLVSLTLRGKDTNTTYNIPFTGPFPKHQTTLARAHSIQRVSPPTAVLETGLDISSLLNLLDLNLTITHVFIPSYDVNTFFTQAL